MTVEVVDGGGRRSSVQLDVELLDVNDQTPEIAWSRYDTYARENDMDLDREVVVQVNAALNQRSGSMFHNILLRLFAASFLVRMLSHAVAPGRTVLHTDGVLLGKYDVINK